MTKEKIGKPVYIHDCLDSVVENLVEAFKKSDESGNKDGFKKLVLDDVERVLKSSSSHTIDEIECAKNKIREGIITLVADLVCVRTRDSVKKEMEQSARELHGDNEDCIFERVKNIYPLSVVIKNIIPQYECAEITEGSLKDKNIYKGNCPFCTAENSFSINDKRGIFFCFKCKCGGDAITFVVKQKNISAMEAISIIENL